MTGNLERLESHAAALREGANSAAGFVRNLYFTFLLLGAYPPTCAAPTCSRRRWRAPRRRAKHWQDPHWIGIFAHRGAEPSPLGPVLARAFLDPECAGGQALDPALQEALGQIGGRP